MEFMELIKRGRATPRTCHWMPPIITPPLAQKFTCTTLRFSIHDVDGRSISDHRLIEADIRLKFGIQKEQPILVEPPGRIFDSMHKYDMRRMGQFKTLDWNSSSALHERITQIATGDVEPSKSELNDLWSTTETSMHHLADYSRKEQKKLGVYQAILRHQDPQARRIETVMDRWP